MGGQSATAAGPSDPLLTSGTGEPERAQAQGFDAQAIKQLEARAEQQAAVAQLSQTALALPDAQELYDAAVLLTAQGVRAQFCGLSEFTLDSERFRVLSAFGMAVTPGALLTEEDAPVPARAMMTGLPVRIDDWNSSAQGPWFSLILERSGVRASAAVPLLRSGRATGALAAHRTAPIPFDDQDVSFLQAMANVVAAYSERRELLTRLQLSDRLAAVGTLAAGVAHEMNNPLTYVLANIQFLDEELQALLAKGVEQKPADLRRAIEALHEAREGAQRLSMIVRDLRVFSRGDADTLLPVELVPVVLSSVNVAQSELRHRARLQLEVLPVPTVRGNPARLGQVCLNLLVNAIQAIPPGEPERHQVAVSTRKTPAGEILLEISDTGCGIPQAQLGRIFDPFFTTKAPGVGTGLGLAICHGIVKQMGGRIEVESTPGKGSTFRVLLPPAPGAPTAPISGPPPKRTRRGRVLLVDDEPLVGMALRRALLADHEVVLVQSARAALEQIALQGPFDALVTDLLMPEMTGMDLFAEIERGFPELSRRTLFVTGGAVTEAAREFLARPGLTLLEKPIEVAVLRKMVGKLVAR